MDSKKEIVELIVGLKCLAKDVKVIMKDGKVDMADLAVLPMFAEQQAQLVAAFSGLGGLDLKDLKLGDYVALIEALVEAAKEVAES